MKRIIFWLITIFIILGLGVILMFIAAHYSQTPVVTTGELTVENKHSLETNSVIEAATPSKESDEIAVSSSRESSETEAIRLAEEFVAQNGYTDLPADKDKITFETVEFGDNLDELLKFRANTLERKAYGILYEATGTKMGEKGWTVIFQEKNVSEDFYKSLSYETGRKITRENYPIGRAVTMDANFQNLLMEHKTFPLENVHKKLK